MKLLELLQKSRYACVFTGAGISTLSGIPDFRSPRGVYSKQSHGLPVETILSHSCFLEHPDYFYEWAKTFVYNAEDYDPNVVHRCIAELQKRGIVKSLYTQNIDVLHQKAGSDPVYELHGSAAHHHCMQCQRHFSYAEIAPLVRQGKVPYCPHCQGLIKPDIVLYEEMLNEALLTQAFSEMRQCDLLLVLGSSLTVQPAASLPVLVLESGGAVAIVNRTPTMLDGRAVFHQANLQETFADMARDLKIV